MSKSIERATQQFINSVVSRGGTQEGAEWCAQALDPFHDCELPNARGFPDGVGLNSVQQTIRLQKTLTKPAAIASPGWDCHMIFFPYVTDYLVTQGFITGNFEPQLTSSGFNINFNPLFAGQGSTALVTGGLNIFSVPVGYDIKGSGTTILVPPPFAGSSQVRSDRISPLSSFLKGNYRVSAQAFEVRSVGPELYKAGTVNCWRVPTPQPVANCLAQCRAFSDTGVQDSTTKHTSAIIVDGWPTTNDEAVLIPQSKTFEAKEGCYVVSRFNNLEPEIVDYPGISPIFIFNTGYNPGAVTSSNASTKPAIGPGGYATTTTVGGAAAITTQLVNTTRMSSFDLCGAQFLGLSDTDVLTVTVKWSITRFPTTQEGDLVVLARPSPTRDEVALAYYAEAIRMLAVGVPVRENNLGDWFRSVVSTVAPVVSKGMQLAVPFLGPKGKAMSVAAEAVSKLANKPEVKKLEKKVVNQVVQKVEKAVEKVKKKKGNKKS